MRWSTIGLIVVGIVAALSAALLVASLAAKPAPTTGQGDKALPEKIRVIKAARDLPALTMVQSADTEAEEVKRPDAPEHYVSDLSTQVLGKVLRAPVVKGQAFTKAHFIEEGSGVTLASGLPAGKRAVELSLSDYASLDGLLYPGSVVDIVASFRLASGRGQAVSTTLLQNVQVLAVDGQTTLSTSQPAKKTEGIVQQSKRRKVTVLVDPDQAQALQLAMGYGELSLSLRNPADTALASAKPAVLGFGKLAEVSYDWPAEELSVIPKLGGHKPPAPLPQTPVGSPPTLGADTQTVAPPPELPPTKPEPPPGWAVKVIRGSDSQDVMLPRPLDAPK